MNYIRAYAIVGFIPILVVQLLLKYLVVQWLLGYPVALAVQVVLLGIHAFCAGYTEGRDYADVNNLADDPCSEPRY
jgi:hypothetical protein